MQPWKRVIARDREIPAGLAAMCVVLLLVVAGCVHSSPERKGRITEPVRRESVSTRVGDLRLIHIRIQRPTGSHAAGSAAGLFLTIANDSAKADTLTAVSSVDAQKVVLRDGFSAPRPAISVPVAARGTVSLQNPRHLHLELTGLKRDLPKRHFVPVTFRFENAGAGTVSVFVQGVDHPVVPQ